MSGPSPNVAKARAIDIFLRKLISGACYEVSDDDSGSKDYSYKILRIRPDPDYHPETDRKSVAEIRISYDKDQVPTSITLRVPNPEDVKKYEKMGDMLDILAENYPQMNISHPYDQDKERRRKMHEFLSETESGRRIVEGQLERTLELENKRKDKERFEELARAIPRDRNKSL